MTSQQLDTQFSAELAERIHSTAEQNFENAYKAALVVENAVYVQGFLVLATVPDTPFEHSWLELEDRIIDPTLPHLETAQPLYYFAAQRLNSKQLQAAIEEAREDYPEDDPLPVYGPPPYEYYGDRMLGGHDYQAAYEAAVVQCQSLQQQA